MGGAGPAGRPGRGGGGRVNGSASRRRPLNWNGNQLPVGVPRPGAGSLRRERASWTPRTVRNFRERVGVSECVRRGERRSSLCESQRVAQAPWRGGGRRAAWGGGQARGSRGPELAPLGGVRVPQTAPVPRRPRDRPPRRAPPGSRESGACGVKGRGGRRWWRPVKDRGRGAGPPLPPRTS